MVGYAACFVLRVLLFRKCRRNSARNEASFWAAVGGVMLLLAIDKQMQAQLWFSQVGRTLIREQGLYDDRRVYQGAFVMIAGATALIAIGALRLLAIRRRWPVWPLVATAFLVSYNQVDQLVNLPLPGARLNLVIELPGVLVISIAALRRLDWRETRQPAEPLRVRQVRAMSDSTRWLLDRSREIVR